MQCCLQAPRAPAAGGGPSCPQPSGQRPWAPQPRPARRGGRREVGRGGPCNRRFADMAGLLALPAFPHGWAGALCAQGWAAGTSVQCCFIRAPAAGGGPSSPRPSGQQPWAPPPAKSAGQAGATCMFVAPLCSPVGESAWLATCKALQPAPLVACLHAPLYAHMCTNLLQAATNHRLCRGAGHKRELHLKESVEVVAIKLLLLHRWCCEVGHKPRNAGWPCWLYGNSNSSASCPAAHLLPPASSPLSGGCA